MAGLAERRARTQRVVAPDGREWTVRRVLIHRRPQREGWLKRKEDKETGDDMMRGLFDGADFLGHIDAPGPIGGVIVVIAIALFLVALALFLWPVFFFALDLLILLLVAGVGLVLRVLGRRPWKIEATTPGPPPEEITWGVVGMRASAKAVQTVADGLRRGDPPGSMLTG